MASQTGVAPPDLIRQDFKLLDSRETLRTTWEIEELLLIQSVHGRSHEGHGAFRGRRYPNTSLDDVTRALRLDPRAVTGERQALIDAVRAYAQSAIVGQAPRALVDQLGEPLLGMSTLRYIPVNPDDVLRGLYMGGLRDSSALRAEVEAERGIAIGGGACYHVDYRRMVDMGLDGEQLAHGEWTDRIEQFEEAGLIVDPTRANAPGVAYQYIRHRKGPGASDDAAIVGAGFLWGIGVALGVFLADAVDTLEKYVPRYGDQDESIALMIEERFADLAIGRQEVKRLTAIAASPEDSSVDVPDSSLRHLLAIDRQTDLCPIEAHLLAVQGTPAPPIALGHERIPSPRFYTYVRKRADEIAA